MVTDRYRNCSYIYIKETKEGIRKPNKTLRFAFKKELNLPYSGTFTVKVAFSPGLTVTALT